MPLKDWLALWAVAMFTLFVRAATTWPHALATLQSEGLLIALAILGLGGGAAAHRMGRANLALTTFVLICPFMWSWALARPSLLLGPLTLLAGLLALLLVTGSSLPAVLLNASVYLGVCALVAADVTSGGLALKLVCLTPVLGLPGLARRWRGELWERELDRWERRLAGFSLGF